MDTFLAIVFCLVAPGVFAIFYNLRLLQGKGNKSFYIADHIYAGRAYVGMPLGIAALLFAAAARFEPTNNIGWVLGYAGLGFVLLSLIFAFTQPSFLKPAWLKWLEREHGDIVPLLRKEADQMGLNTWNNRIQTQADLEEWVAEVRCKHKV